MGMGMGFVIWIISEYHAHPARQGSRPKHIESLPPLRHFRLVISCRVIPHDHAWEGTSPMPRRRGPASSPTVKT